MRRVALGSGIDAAKLASTIRQIAISDPPLPVLICQAASNPDAWIHLSLSLELQDDLPTPDSYWMLMLGYPLREDVRTAIARHNIALPAHSHVIGSEPGLNATIQFPYTTPPDEIAQIINALMVNLQRVEQTAAVELALEYP